MKQIDKQKLEEAEKFFIARAEMYDAMPKSYQHKQRLLKDSQFAWHHQNPNRFASESDDFPL